ncbi:MAG: hypothetical protein L0219_14070 [Phycisphaerales bacterium]|nr:hypothetical protein [Phycisphaerales bacterium]
MKPESAKISEDRCAQLEEIQQAARDAVRQALRRHMLLGESVAVADESGRGVKMLGPKDIRKALKAA